MVAITSKIIVAALILSLAGCNKGPGSQNRPLAESNGIIPLPRQADFSTGSIVIDKTTVFIRDDSFPSANKIIDDALSISLNEGISVSTDTTNVRTIMYAKDKSLSDEAYGIHISDKGIILKAGSPAGAFYAAQSLSQMIWEISRGIKKSSLEMRCADISDAPVYRWRGFHLDVARHFFTKEYIMKIIDELAYYKINKLHLHLSDDQGWRIEITGFPLLTETGAWRTLNGMDSACMEKAKTDSRYNIDPRFLKMANGKTIYGGYYTRQDISGIIAYAGDRFIEVIPEIDMPGHMSAAINAYPFLSCTGSSGWDTEFSYPVCPCNQEVMNFCHLIWDEIAALFPSVYVHIGSDEVEKNSWTASSECQDFMTQNNLHTTNEIQNYFVNDIQHYLESKGKKVIAWDDVIDGKVDDNLTIMYWRDWVKDSPSRCAANGNSLILTPWSPFYISGSHTDKTLQDLYDYNPVSALPSGVAEKVIGIQSCVWTEEIPSEAVFEYLVYPRMQALSEVEWGAGKDWNSFKLRLESNMSYMTFRNIHFRRPGWAQ